MKDEFKVGNRVTVIKITKYYKNYKKYLHETGVIERIYGDGSNFGNQILFDNKKIRTTNCFDNKELILGNINKRISQDKN